MKLVVVFPDNSVEIDGEPVKWTVEEFRRHSIELVREKVGVLGSSERKEMGGREFIIFPTREHPGVVYADANDKRQLQQEGINKDKRGWTCNESEDATNTEGEGFSQRGHKPPKHPATERLGVKLKDSLTSRGIYEPSWQENWTEVATRLCRVDDGIPNRVDRIKSGGNAIVPQVAAEIFKAIKAVEGK